jgi:predicted nucleic acid-binding Zn ribbon protein
VLARADFAKAEYNKEKKCVICGSIFHNSDERRKTCSAECAKILKESNHGLKRFRHKGGEIIDYGITLKRVFERDKGKCWICGCQTNFDDVLYTEDGHKYCGKTHPVKDHLIPLSCGGNESWENIRLACWQCNKEKSDALVNIDETTRGKKLVVSERCGKKDGSIPIAQYSINGELIKVFESMRQASRETGIPHCQISAVKNGLQKTAHGYIWKAVLAG